MNPDSQFKYDVAFSFLARDLGIAEHLGDGLSPLKSFIWKREQETIAGTNGMETFPEVFREQARLNVVLLRDRWGETDWTRVESMAIQARALKGWDSLFVVKLDNAPSPSWIPPQLIHLNYEVFGPTETVGAIRACAVKIGAPSRRESAEELAQRLARRAAQAEENGRLWRSDAGAKLAGAEVRQLFETMKAAVDSTQGRGDGSPTIESGYTNTALGMRCNGKSMSIDWRRPYSNTLDDARLYVAHVAGHIPIPGDPPAYIIDRPTSTDWRIYPEFSETGALHWRDKRLPSAVSRSALGEHLLTSFLTFAYIVPKKTRINIW